MAGPFLVFCEPVDLARFTRGEDPDLAALIEGPEPEREYREDTRFLDEIVPLIEQLPPIEADIFSMYYVAKKRQSDIAKIFGLSQAAISYTIDRSAARIKLMLQLPRLSDAEVKALLDSTPLSDLTQTVLMAYRHTSQQTITAEALGMTQGRVRYHIFLGCARLSRWAVDRPELREVTRLFCLLRDHPNMLIKSRYSRWHKRPIDDSTERRRDDQSLLPSRPCQKRRPQKRRRKKRRPKGRRSTNQLGSASKQPSIRS